MEKTVDLLNEYNGKRIAIYGLGADTPKVLETLPESITVIGLLDSFEVSGEMYGKPIISLDDAIEMGVKLVLVVARPGSCKAIARKIGSVCEQNGVALFDVRGENLLEETKVVYDFKGLAGYTQADVRKQIEQAEAVSFDLFDTLITRRTLFPTDVFDIVEERLKERAIFLAQFIDKRIAAEKRLSKEYAPRLCEIYEQVLSDSKVKVSAEELVELEYSVDISLLLPRKAVVDLLVYAKSMGKKVYLTSDTYYRKEQIVGILRKCGIESEWFDDLLISCEHGTSKTQNLFAELIRIARTDNIMHIGDDVVADIQNAERYAIHTFQLYNGRDLLDAVGGLGLNEYTDDLSDRIRLGMFVSGIFNSPFQFEDEECRLQVESAYDIGYLFCAPMISDFVLWFKRQVEELEVPNIWFGARDGYLIQKLYGMLDGCKESVYLLTSRIAAVRAGVVTEEDIRYVDAMKYSGELEDALRERFGIDASQISCEDVNYGETGLLKYTGPILENAISLRENYREYISKQSIQAGDIVFFDFVAKGTVQLYLEKIVEKHIKGLYFLQLERNSMADKVEVESFYDGEEKGSAIYDNYYILETVLTAPHASVSGFGKHGEPIYSKETREEKDITCAMKAQAGIEEWFRTYLKICPQASRKLNQKMDEIILMLIRNTKILDEDFLAMFVEDPFFNRMTKITDVL